MAVEEGLLMPAIMDCGNKSLAEIASASKDLIDRAKSGALHPQEYTGGTFSISNLGMFDVTSFVAIIQPPQSAMLRQVSREPVSPVGDQQPAAGSTAAAWSCARPELRIHRALSTSA